MVGDPHTCRNFTSRSSTRFSGCRSEEKSSWKWTFIAFHCPSQKPALKQGLKTLGFTPNLAYFGEGEYPNPAPCSPPAPAEGGSAEQTREALVKVTPGDVAHEGPKTETQAQDDRTSSPHTSPLHPRAPPNHRAFWQEEPHISALAEEEISGESQRPKGTRTDTEGE